jgi:hypothetical protein
MKTRNENIIGCVPGKVSLAQATLIVTEELVNISMRELADEEGTVECTVALL